jgi:hypothetical protein
MPRPPLEKYPIELLKAELARRARKAGKKLKKLIRVRAKLTEQIAELEALAGGTPMAAPKAKLGRPPGRKPGRKPKPAVPAPEAIKRGRKGRSRGKPLAEYVHAVLAATEKGLSLKEIEAKVLAAGYPTTAESIYKPIMKVLGKGFKKVERGVYALGAAVKAGEKAAKAAMTEKPGAQVKVPRKRGTFKQNASEFVLGLVKGKGAMTAEIGKKWKAAGRGGKADNALTKLVKEGKVKRTKLAEGQGSLYTLT